MNGQRLRIRLFSIAFVLTMVSTAAAQEPNARYGEVLSARLAAQPRLGRWSGSCRLGGSRAS